MEGNVIWITGLSASGKTTLATALVTKLRETEKNVIFLDGDEIRAVLDEVNTHSQEDRLRLAFLYGRLCQLLSAQGACVVIATVALFREIHEWNRQNLPNYFEIWLDVPLSELRRRDPKKIYKRFEMGELKNIAGLDLPVDFPTNPHVTFHFIESQDLEQMVFIILRKLSLNLLRYNIDP